MQKIWENMYCRAGCLWTLIAILTITSHGCAPPRPPAPASAEEYVWPLPPDQPRIRYVRSIHSEMDIGRKRSLAQRIFEAIFGRPRLRAVRKPLAVHADRLGRLFVVDTGWRKVLMFDFKQNRLEVLGRSGKGLLLNPLGITTDNSNNIYVTDAGGHRVVVYDSNGVFLQAFGGEDKLIRPAGIAVNSKLGIAYVVDTWAHQIKVFYIHSGNLLFTIGKNLTEMPDKPIEGALDQTWNRGRGEAEFCFPTQIAIDPDGNLYVVDTMNFRVQIIAPNGKFIRSFGQIGNVPGTFSRPKGIGLDSEGHIYVADAAFNNVQIFDKDGKLLLHFGRFGFGPADLRLPAGLFIDHEDRIYVADQLNSRVQVYQYLGSGPGETQPVIAVDQERR